MPIRPVPADRDGLVTRIERVERMLGITTEPSAGDPQRPGEGTLEYGGSGPWSDGVVAWHQDRTWAEVTRVDSEVPANVFAALSSPARVDIVVALLGGELSTADVGSRVDSPSTGQLHHHLRDLLAAGLIHQPRRGTYAIRHQHVVPILTLLSACRDVGQVRM
jgi:DNA-binding transcriptional ArsR family regulator